jgi:hypothetical protein
MADDRDTRDRRVEKIQFWVIFFATFLIFVSAASVQRLLPRGWTANSSSTDKLSIIARARVNAGTVSKFAFMG